MLGLFNIPKTKGGTKATCVSCGLYKDCVTPKMQVGGKGKKRILLIGNSPTYLEDKRNQYWQSKVGIFLRDTLHKYGVDVDEDCWSINSINCRCTEDNGEDRYPTFTEKDACRKHVLQTITKTQPVLIIALGYDAFYSVAGHRWQKDFGQTIFKWRGWQIPDRALHAWVCPMDHPTHAVDTKRNPEINTVWQQDIKSALDLLNKPMPTFTDEADAIRIVDTEQGIYDLLRKLLKVPFFAFDIETTGLKPHNVEAHKIKMTAFAYNEDEAFVIPGELSVRNLRLLKKVMQRKAVGKIAHNMKFEHTWFFNIYDIEIKGWFWDSMQAAHIINNSPGISGLKFQTFVQFGEVDYDSEVSGWLKPKKSTKDGNAVNQIEEGMQNPLVKKKLQIYCGMDALFTYRLTLVQRKQLKYETT